MAGQVLWFLPLVFVGLLVATVQAPSSWTLRPEHQAILLWAGCLATYWLVYSFAGGIFHDYYVVTMSAPMAALTGIGGAALWKSFAGVSRNSVAAGRRGAARYLWEGWCSLLLPLALLLTAGWQALIWLNYPEVANWTVPFLFIMATATGLGLLALRGSWPGLVLTAGLLACIGWLWSRETAAPDILTLAAGELDKARAALRDLEGWDSFKRLYTKFSPDITTLVPDLRRQASLVSPPLLLGCGIAGGCLLILFVLAKWRPIVAKGAAVAAAICFLALYVGPGVWALSPLWSRSAMLPAADASVFARTFREREQVAREAGQVAALAMRASHSVTLPNLVAAPATLLASEVALFTRGMARVGRPDVARNGPGNRGRLPLAPATGPAAGFPGPGMPPGDDARSRPDREKLVAFLQANHNGERWVLAVSGSQQAGSYIIEDGLSVMPIGGFGGGAATLGTDPEEIKARLNKLVEDGQVRFFQVGGGRGGFRGGVGRAAAGGFGPQGPPGFNGPPAPQGGGLPGAGPPAGFGRGSAVVSEWIQEQVEKGKAKRVDRKLYATETVPEGNPGGRRGGPRGFGMMGGGGDLYDLRPELELR
jgi:hypothetical protein